MASQHVPFLGWCVCLLSNFVITCALIHTYRVDILAVSTIQQDGPHEALIASSVPHGSSRNVNRAKRKFCRIALTRGRHVKPADDERVEMDSDSDLDSASESEDEKEKLTMVDPRSDSIVGSIMFRKVDRERRQRGVLLGDSFTDWNTLQTHFIRLRVWLEGACSRTFISRIFVTDFEHMHLRQRNPKMNRNRDWPRRRRNPLL